MRLQRKLEIHHSLLAAVAMKSTLRAKDNDGENDVLVCISV